MNRLIFIPNMSSFTSILLYVYFLLAQNCTAPKKSIYFTCQSQKPEMHWTLYSDRFPKDFDFNVPLGSIMALSELSTEQKQLYDSIFNLIEYPYCYQAENGSLPEIVMSRYTTIKFTRIAEKQIVEKKLREDEIISIDSLLKLTFDGIGFNKYNGHIYYVPKPENEHHILIKVNPRLVEYD